MRSVRSRVASLAPRPPSRVARAVLDVARRADLALTPDAVARRGLAIAAGAAAAGGMMVGPPAAPVCFLGAIVALVVWSSRRASARMRRIAAAFPDAVRALADALRSGMNLQQALDIAARDEPGPLGVELRRVVAEAEHGIGLPEAIASFAERCPVAGADILALATMLAWRSGADLVPIFEGVVETARDRERLRRELRAATAQGRLTATVVAALPFAFLAIIGSGAHGEIHLLLHEPIGWLLLGVGLTLEAAGFAWIRRVSDRP